MIFSLLTGYYNDLLIKQNEIQNNSNSIKYNHILLIFL